MTTIRVGDYGIPITATVVDSSGSAVDISSATAQTIIIKRPTAATINTSTSFVTDGTDGQVTYTLADGDVSEVGTYEYQIQIVLPAGQNTTIRGLFYAQAVIS